MTFLRLHYHLPHTGNEGKRAYINSFEKSLISKHHIVYDDDSCTAVECTYLDQIDIR